MIDTQKIDEIVNKLAAALPKSIHSLKQELEKNFRTILQNAFSKMDLVTREEFDVQVSVLKRTRQHLEELEEKVSKLEQKKAKK